MPDSVQGEWASLLFFSCDLVGSTRFKQSGAPNWPGAFLSFYREFPQQLGELSRQPGIEFKLWKAIGDELVFTVAVRHEREVYKAVGVWLEALKAYEDSSLRDQTHMQTKSGGFVATFPGPDSRIAIPTDPRSEVSDKGVAELNDEAYAPVRPDLYFYDYLGPSIDTGFRVIQACDARYFTMSVELAWAYCRGAQNAGVFVLPELTVREPREFKGVWDGRDYPLVALDRRKDDPVNAALATLNPQSAEITHVEALCMACSDSSNWPSAIYLPDSDFDRFKRDRFDALNSIRLNAMQGAESVATDIEPLSLEETIQRLDLHEPPLD